MALSPTVQAAITRVAGEWALGMATAPDYDPHTRKYEPTQPSQISAELEQHFAFAHKFLTDYLS